MQRRIKDMGRKSRYEYLAENDYDWNMQKTDKKYREYMKNELECLIAFPKYKDTAKAILTISREELEGAAISWYSMVTDLEGQVEDLKEENEKLRKMLNANYKVNQELLKSLEMV